MPRENNTFPPNSRSFVNSTRSQESKTEWKTERSQRHANARFRLYKLNPEQRRQWWREKLVHKKITIGKQAMHTSRFQSSGNHPAPIDREENQIKGWNGAPSPAKKRNANS